MLKKDSRENKELFFEEYYKKGFLPLELIINPENIALAKKITSKKSVRAKKKSHIDISNLIGAKVFAAFINDEGEIVVGDNIYRFTPLGLFFGNLKDSVKIRKAALKNYNKNETSGKSKSQIGKQQSIYLLRREEGGGREIERGVFRYITPTRRDPPDHYYGGGGGGSSSSLNPKDSDIGLNNLVENLRVINNPDSSWFQNIFGTYRYAHEYFSNDDYRFELDYYNQRYLIYRELGVEAETHKEGWFWWNNVKSDEMILGINKIHAVLTDLPRPKIETLTLGEVFPNSNPSDPVYMHNNSFEIKNNGRYDPVSIKVLANKGVPYFKYYDDAILNIYIGKLFGYTIDKSISYNVLSDSNIRFVYKLGVDFFKKHTNAQRKDFFVTIQRNDNEIDMLYFNEYIRKYNVSSINKKIVSEFAGQVSADVIDGKGKPDWSKTIKDLITGEAFVGKYKFKELDFYGIARRGNEWRGLKIKLKE